jgi:predicted nucleic acid-binding protein
VNGWLLDTNVVAELASPRGMARVHDWATAQDEALLFLSVLTLGEYDKGLHNLPPGSPLRPRIAASIAALEARFAHRVLPLSDAVIRRWGMISGMVKRLSGHVPPVIDTMLAATAIEHDFYLVTRNLRDVQLSGARLFNPWEDNARPGHRRR